MGRKKGRLFYNFLIFKILNHVDILAVQKIKLNKTKKCGQEPQVHLPKGS